MRVLGRLNATTESSLVELHKQAKEVARVQLGLAPLDPRPSVEWVGRDYWPEVGAAGFLVVPTLGPLSFVAVDL